MIGCILGVHGVIVFRPGQVMPWLPHVSATHAFTVMSSMEKRLLLTALPVYCNWYAVKFAKPPHGTLAVMVWYPVNEVGLTVAPFNAVTVFGLDPPAQERLAKVTPPKSICIVAVPVLLPPSTL